jgi:hypothetical protein
MVFGLALDLAKRAERDAHAERNMQTDARHGKIPRP